MPIADIVHIQADGRFRLVGRTADLVNIAGKRTSLAYLNHQLNAIPGVIDGAFYLPDDPSERSAIGVLRVGAVAVAPGLTIDEVTRELRRRLDSVFMPRPLKLVSALPRNSTGKLPVSVLLALASRA